MHRVPFGRALRASTTHHYDYLNAYVNDLGNVLGWRVHEDEDTGQIDLEPINRRVELREWDVSRI